MLRERGYQVRHLSRSARPNATFPTYRWDIASGHIDEGALNDLHAIIHLAGAGIADKRWTEARKREILDSRVKSTALLASQLQARGAQLPVFVAASAIGYYGNRGGELVDETSAPGENTFMVETCVAWEKASDAIEAMGIRTVKLRVGIVLSTKSGALPELLNSFRFRVGTYLGDGGQFYSWIHLDDVCRMFIKAMEDEAMHGVYNAVAPVPVSNKALTHSIETALGRSAIVFGVPAFALRLMLGSMADVVLHGNKVSAQKIQDAGFEFQHPQLVPALKDLLARNI